jgi:hypothetical protein
LLASSASSDGTGSRKRLAGASLWFYKQCYEHSIENALAFLDGKPIRVLPSFRVERCMITFGTTTFDSIATHRG